MKLLEGPPKPYMDEHFRECRGAYLAFLTRLHNSSMLEFVELPAIETVGFFGVAKNNGKVRLVVDARRANCWFSRPRPGSALHRC